MEICNDLTLVKPISSKVTKDKKRQRVKLTHSPPRLQSRTCWEHSKYTHTHTSVDSIDYQEPKKKKQNFLVSNPFDYSLLFSFCYCISRIPPKCYFWCNYWPKMVTLLIIDWIFAIFSFIIGLWARVWAEGFLDFLFDLLVGWKLINYCFICKFWVMGIFPFDIFECFLAEKLILLQLHL